MSKCHIVGHLMPRLILLDKVGHHCFFQCLSCGSGRRLNALVNLGGEWDATSTSFNGIGMSQHPG